MDRDPASTPSLARELERVAARFHEGPVRLADLADVFGARGSFAFLAVLSLPFLSPVPLLGLATPAGLLVVVMGIQIARGRPPRLPARLARETLPPRFLPRLIRGAGRLLQWLERLVRPRGGWLGARLIRPPLTGSLLAVAGLILLLPIPMPLSNALPASAILLLSVAAMQQDAVAFLLGCAALAASFAFLGAVAWGGWELFGWMRTAG